MSVDQDLVTQVKERAVKLAEAQVLEKPPTPINVYTDEFGGYLAQMDQDREKWVESGFDWEKRALGEALQAVLLDSQAEVIVTRKNDVNDAQSGWLGEKDKVILERKRLQTAVKFSYADEKGAEAPQKEISKGSTNLEKVADILALIKMARVKVAQTSKLVIDKVRIDQAFLDSTQTWAEGLVAKLNKANAARNSRSSSVNFRNRVVTLCEEYLATEVRKWVPVVYFNDPESQSKFFSNYKRGGGSSGEGGDDDDDNSSGGNSGGGGNKKQSDEKTELESSLV